MTDTEQLFIDKAAIGVMQAHVEALAMNGHRMSGEEFKLLTDEIPHASFSIAFAMLEERRRLFPKESEHIQSYKGDYGENS